MTYILAWRDKSNVYISGDSAVSRRNVSDDYINDVKNKGVLTTSFGETLVLTNEKVVEESVLKIHNINNNFIIGYAGTGDVAIDVIKALEEEGELTKNNIVRKIKGETLRFGSDFQMVIGFFDKRSSILLSFNLYGKRKVRSHPKFTPVGLGNMRNDDLLKLVSSDMIDTFITSSITKSAERRIVMTSAFVQVVILRANLLPNGVGGFFSGAYLNKHGFFWQKDLGIIDFKMKPLATKYGRDPNLLFRSPQFVGIIIRDNKVAILSSKLFANYSDFKIFSQYINSYELKQFYEEYEIQHNNWIIQNQQEITDIITNFDYDYFVFICTDKDVDNKMTFVSKESLSATNYFTLFWQGTTPTFDIAGETVEEINPLTTEFWNQLHWLP